MADVKYTTEMTQKVFDNDYGFAVIVGEDQDGLGLVTLQYSEDGTETPGVFPAISINPLMAKEVAKAIINQATFIMEREAKK